MVEDVPELADDGPVPLRERELPFEGLRIDDDGVGPAEQALELRPRLLVHRAPVELAPLHLEAALGRGLDRHRPVDAVGDEVALRDRLPELVAEGRPLDLEEAEGVAHEAAVLGVGGGDRCRVRRARGRGEAQLDAVEVPERAAPLAVDRSVALVGDDEVEVAGREAAVLRDHRLQGGDGDALGPVEAAPRPQHVARVVAEVVGEGVLGLGGEGDPVHQEEDAGDRAGLEQALDEGGGGAGLAGPRRHLDEELPPPARHLGRERLDAVDLVAAVHDPSIDRHVGQRAPQRVCGDPAFQIVLGVEGGDLTGVGVPAAIQEAHFLAVRQEDERNVEQRCVMDALILGGDRVDARPLRFDDRHRAPGAVAEHVVRARAVPERVLEEDAHPVGQVPAGILEPVVDPDPRECFGGSGHWTYPLSVGALAMRQVQCNQDVVRRGRP